MIILFIISIFFTVSCGQDLNSNSFDEFKFTGEVSGTIEFVNAYKVIEKRCISCHTGAHSQWSQYKESEEWERESLVISRNVTDSLIVSRLINNGGDMPQGGSSLPAEDIETLTKWINSL
jgi:hypothetical protein